MSGELDREHVAQYSLTIEARDNPRLPLSQQRKTSRRMVIDIMDINDSIPTFEQDHYEATVLENVLHGVIISRVRATDDDTEVNSAIRYSVKESEGNATGNTTITWKLANIVPIPKPNKDIDKGTTYMLISLLSVIAKTLERSLIRYITANIPNTAMQHGYETQHSTVTALHTLNNTVAKGFNQMAPPARTITVALDMSKAFNTINIHTLIRKLLQTDIPGTIIKFIANYIKRHKAYKTYIHHTSKQLNLKLAFHKVASFHPHYLTFTPQTYHHPVHRFRSRPTQTTSQSHPHTQVRVQPRNTYNHTYMTLIIIIR